MLATAGPTPLKFVAARLPEAVAAVPGTYEVAVPEESSSEADSDSESNDSPSSPQSQSTPNTEHSDSEPDVEDDSRALKFYDVNENANDTGSRPNSRIHKSWAASQQPPVGLVNLGVTCYMNAAIQMLFHLPALGHYLQSVLSNHTESGIQRSSVTYELALLFKRVVEGHKKQVHPSKIIKRLPEINCMMSVYQQEDAHEYYMSLISRLQEDSVPKGQKLDTSIIAEIFAGKMEQEVSCVGCGHVSTTTQDFYDLPLSFRKPLAASNVPRNQAYTLQRSIQEFFAPETIKAKGSEGYVCEGCKSITRAVKHNTIKSAPEYLTVHLKRFKFEGDKAHKVKEPMAYPEKLDLTTYSSVKEPLVYSLLAVTTHEGRSLSSGHYMALCMQPNGTWTEYDDEVVGKVDKPTATNQDTAYILVYSRLAAKKSASRGYKRAGPSLEEKSLYKRRATKRAQLDAASQIEQMFSR